MNPTADKIRKLLRLGQQDTPEGATARAIAEKLKREAGITHVDMREPEMLLVYEGPWATWRNELIAAVADLYGVDARSQSFGETFRFYLAGVRAREAKNYVRVIEILVEGAFFQYALPFQYSRSAPTLSSSFALGMVRGIAARLPRIPRASVLNQPSGPIVRAPHEYIDPMKLMFGLQFAARTPIPDWSADE